MSRALRRLHPAAPRPRPAARGFTLLELLIAMTIGLVVLAASLLVYTSSSRGSQVSQLETQLNEDGILALNLIQQQLKQAGYSQQIIPPSGATVLGNYAGLAVRGCDNGFTDSGAAFDSLACSNTAGSAAAIAVRYQATLENTMPTAGANPRPTNCLGDGITPQQPSQAAPAPTPAAPNYALADNRYFITIANGQPSLSCRGSEGAAIGGSQPLLANVESMRITYGVARWPSLELANSHNLMRHQIVQYLSASEIDALPSSGQIPGNDTHDRWGRVLSVRVCLLMRSDQPVRDAPDGALNYKSCTNTDAVSGDNHLRRAFTTTVLLRNRLFTQ